MLVDVFEMTASHHFFKTNSITDLLQAAFFNLLYIIYINEMRVSLQSIDLGILFRLLCPLAYVGRIELKAFCRQGQYCSGGQYTGTGLEKGYNL